MNRKMISVLQMQRNDCQARCHVAKKLYDWSSLYAKLLDLDHTLLDRIAYVVERTGQKCVHLKLHPTISSHDFPRLDGSITNF